MNAGNSDGHGKHPEAAWPSLPPGKCRHCRVSSLLDFSKLSDNYSSGSATGRGAGGGGKDPATFTVPLPLLPDDHGRIPVWGKNQLLPYW